MVKKDHGKHNKKPERAKVGDTIKIVANEDNPSWVEIGRSFVVSGTYSYGDECGTGGCKGGDHVKVSDEDAGDDIYLHDCEYEIIKRGKGTGGGNSWVDYIRRR